MRQKLPASMGSRHRFEPPTARLRTENESPRIFDRKLREECLRSSPGEASDQSLIERFREGDQDSATQLYFRYSTRVTNLVKNRCSVDLARCAGVEDIVQCVFATFFRRIAEGVYHFAEGQRAWKLLLVIALNRIRSRATYYFATKRDAHRTISGEIAQHRLNFQADANACELGQGQLVLKEFLERLPPQYRLLTKLRIDGFAVEDVALMTGCSKRTVERALRAVRSKLSQDTRKTL